MNSPKISIVTPSYNQGQYIEETIDSILSQNYQNLEYIIIDGGSSDGSIDVIKKYAKHLKYWVSEPDRGQSDAIMKGLKYCTGDIFNWINSDDYLASNALQVIADEFSDEFDALAGKVILFNNSRTEETLVRQRNLTPTNLIHWTPGTEMTQPGIWLKRNKIFKCGGINHNLNYAFDREMMIRYFYLFPSIKYIEASLVYFRLHENSKTVSSPEMFASEDIMIANSLLNNPMFIGLNKACKKRIEKNNWSVILEKEITNHNKYIIFRAIKILLKSFCYPSTRLNRKTLGAIKLILLKNK